MGNLIILEAKEVKVKGLDVSNKPDEEKLKEYFFDEDYANLKLLDQVQKFKRSENLNWFYPGCGSDILFPLVYLEKLFPNVTEVQFNFLDLENFLGIIKTILDDIGVTFSEVGEKDNFGNYNEIKFYWKGKLVNLKFVRANAFTYLENVDSYDIYFERAFRIMRDKEFDYEMLVLSRLRNNGVLISDSGFLGKGLEYIDVPVDLSSYGEMVLGRKK
ncbi:MAG: hypothetical protein ABIG93_00755 [archaeon]|nr:hypothetical protein [Nanoarchaeota archaeon]